MSATSTTLLMLGIIVMEVGLLLIRYNDYH
jgi:hypothetical protein